MTDDGGVRAMTLDDRSTSLMPPSPKPGHHWVRPVRRIWRWHIPIGRWRQVRTADPDVPKLHLPTGGQERRLRKRS